MKGKKTAKICGRKAIAQTIAKGQGLLITGMLTLISTVARSQAGGAGITNATNEVKLYFAIGTDLMYAIGAVLGLVGAVKVYTKWNSGDQDTSKAASLWFGSCIFLLVVATILKGFFKV